MRREQLVEPARRRPRGRHRVHGRVCMRPAGAVVPGLPVHRHGRPADGRADSRRGPAMHRRPGHGDHRTDARDLVRRAAAAFLRAALHRTRGAALGLWRLVPQPGYLVEPRQRLRAAVRHDAARRASLRSGRVHGQRASRSARQARRLLCVHAGVGGQGHGRCLPAGRRVLHGRGQPACGQLEVVRRRLRERRQPRARRGRRAAH
mmetsp:Transcript_16490/g.35737  ORF Transcript_16490/g.35737 Transcript_16490/m.35737 type:complete len:205 (-) Transcript_16490:463-1077(-)